MWRFSPAFFVCLYFAKPIFAVLVQPLLAAGQGKLIYTDIFEAFFVEVKVAFFAALMISFPVLATQIWRFVAPGMYKSEKKAFLPFLLMTPFFFAAGAAFAYFVAMPWALKFLLSFEGNVGGVTQEALPAIGNYLSFVTRFLFGFGVAFLLPVLLMVLERAGIVTREQLAASRRYAIVAAAGGFGGADPARRRLDAADARAALRALRVRDPGDPADPLARRRGGPRKPQPMLWKCPGQMWARKRHRGGEGWRFRAHLSRIARAGGQKVTIRTTKTPSFPSRFRAISKNYSTVRRISAASRLARPGKTGKVTA